MTRFNDLIDGYHRFRDTGWARERGRWSELAEGQSPRVMIIACSDSRVEPAIIFDASPGEMFVVRNVANLAPPFETTGGYHGVSAALEFAVTQLEVEESIFNQLGNRWMPVMGEKQMVASPRKQLETGSHVTRS
jgi:carbonic anhydrase